MVSVRVRVGVRDVVRVRVSRVVARVLTGKDTG